MTEPSIPISILTPIVFDLAMGQAKVFGEISPATQKLMDLILEYLEIAKRNH